MKKEILDRIIDRLKEYKDTEHYACDLGYTLFEGENLDGSFTYNTYAAEQWIKDNFRDIGPVVDELKFQFGENFMKNYNPFDNPEKFMVLIILEVASYLISRCKLVQDNWDNKIVLDEEIINTLSEQLEEQKSSSEIYA